MYILFSEHGRKKYPVLSLAQQPKIDKIRNKTNNRQTQLY
jgi:hypothetical protein